MPTTVRATELTADVTETVQDRRLLFALRAASMYVWERDMASTEVVRFGNWEDVLGAEIGSIEDFIAHVHPDDRDVVRTAIAGVIARSESYEMEFRFICDSGEERWVRDVGRRIVSDSEDRFVGVCIDITTEAQARHAAANARALAEKAAEAKSRFLSMMSHELRTPLNAVTGFSDLLVTRMDLDPAAIRQIDQIRQAASDLTHLVDDILAFTLDGTDVAMTAFSVSEVVQTAASLAVSDAAAKALVMRVNDGLPPAARYIGDAGRLRQILRVLVSNAVKFTPRGEIEITVMPVHGGVQVQVADSGPGVSDELLERLFQPFTQADDSRARAHEGAGVGLALCKRLVDLLGGEIGVANRTQGGAEFWVRLPMEVVGVREAASLVELIEPLQAPRVLVVDDHASNREVAGLMLGAAGCDVFLANDGEEAVEAVRSSSFDLILMDVRMPRMDGLQATRAIRALQRSGVGTPIVGFTADAMPEDVLRCREAGMDDHLAKPVSQAALWSVLMRFLGGEQESSALA